jgi:hypothetical protein
VVFALASVVDPNRCTRSTRTSTAPSASPPWASPLDAAIPASGLVVLIALVAAAWSLVGRFRRAAKSSACSSAGSPWGAALAALALVVAIAELALVGDTALFQAALGVCLALLPLATGAAILRYRLYDLDRLISRTVAYGLLTVLLGGGYGPPPRPGRPGRPARRAADRRRPDHAASPGAPLAPPRT